MEIKLFYYFMWIFPLMAVYVSIREIRAYRRDRDNADKKKFWISMGINVLGLVFFLNLLLGGKHP